METQRFARLMNAFSKKWEKLHAALALYFAYYNICRTHKTPRCSQQWQRELWIIFGRWKEVLLAATGESKHQSPAVESADAANQDDDL